MHISRPPAAIALVVCLVLALGIVLPAAASHHEEPAAASATPTDRTAERDQRKAERDQRKAEREQRKAERQGTSDGRSVDDIYAQAASDATGVVRTDLGIVEPGSAPGEALGLWHYSIPAGQELAPHRHPGWQLARVTAGELEYSVISGEGQLLRADGSVEPMGPGTYVLTPGDGVIENPGLVHYGANRGDALVTLISASLFEASEPIATLVDTPAADMSDAGSSQDPEMAEPSPAG